MISHEYACSRPPRLEGPEDHHQKISAPCTCATCFADDPRRGERLTAEAAGLFLDYSKNRVTDETLKLLVQLAEESGLRSGSTRCSAASKINVTEGRAVLHVALRAPRSIDPGRWRGRRAGGPCRARRMAGFLGARAERGVERPHRPADQERDQYRHRRLRPRAGHGLRGAASIIATAR